MDVVVPFRGAPAHLEELRARLAGLQLQPGDSIVVVDNTPGRRPVATGQDGRIPVIHAVELATPGYARNRGAERGSAEWLVFIDADISPPPDLLDRYFDPPPGERTGLVAGEVIDEPVPMDGRPAARYAYIRRLLSHESTLRGGDRFGFPNTSNRACRRSAFEAVGGFRENIRAAEDGDLTFRFRDAGWEVERREAAAGVHTSRQTIRAFVAQKACHGAGAAWLEQEYPGCFPARRRPGLVWWGVRHAAKGLLSAARSRDRDAALWAIFDPLEQLSFEFGRSLPNERPLPRRWALLRGRRGSV